MSNLTAKQKAFIDHYVVCKNATESARRAGYRGSDQTLGVVGHENLRKPKIKEAIEKLFAERVMTRNEVLARLHDIATGTAEDWLTVDRNVVMPDLAKLLEAGKGHLVKSVEFRKGVVKFELHDAHAALRDIAKIYGLFSDNTTNVNVTVENTVMPEQERHERIRAIASEYSDSRPTA